MDHSEIKMGAGGTIRPRPPVNAGSSVSRTVSIDGWLVTVGWDVYAPVNGPSLLSIHIDLDNVDAVDPNGLTAALLRRIPLQQICEELTQLRAVARAIDEGAIPKPGQNRFSTARDYAELARGYARLVELGDRTPVATLAKLTKTPKNTISARIRRARDEHKFLAGSEHELATQLTDKALRVLEQAGKEEAQVGGNQQG